MSKHVTDIGGLNDRSRTILRKIVESYLATGEPVGSRNLSRELPIALSPASVRNVMADLEHLGLISSPHTSAGRMPTEQGLRLFVDALLETGNLSNDERRQIENKFAGNRDKSVDEVLSEASEMISGLSHCAGLVISEKQVGRLKHIEFVPLEPGKALAILVDEDQGIENRIINLPAGLPTSALVEASNYLNAHIRGATLSEARQIVERKLAEQKAELDKLTQQLITAGLADWSGALDDRRSLIVRGRSNLLKDVHADDELLRIRQLFDALESKNDIIQLLGLAERGEGVRIFIGRENKSFSLSGSSLIIAPFQDRDENIVGVLGVIGPKRLNYARIIPMVDFTAQVVSRMLT
ncbi:MAG: heat-inducible transcriptional repressor HrcA [Alphaproteobacteria bacterium]|nr:heat-inducible transcriptional repressor HrcA [Alphaproteobacteria bacterium]